MKVKIKITLHDGSVNSTEMQCEDFKDGMKKAFLWYENRSNKSRWDKVDFNFER